MLVRCCSFARGGERSRLCVVLINSLYSETLVVKMCQCYPHSAVVVVFARGLGLGSLHVIPFDCRTPAISSVLSEQSWSFVLRGGGGRGSKGGVRGRFPFYARAARDLSHSVQGPRWFWSLLRACVARIRFEADCSRHCCATRLPTLPHCRAD